MIASMRHILALLALVWSLPSAAQAMYSKSTEFSALRVSYSAMQTLLDKAGSLSSTANGGSIPEREEVALQARELKISLSGRQFLSSPAKVPDQIDSLNYSYFASRGSPITQVELDLSGYRRVLAVRGSSADQVDAVFAALSSELTALSHPVGGGAVQSFLRVMMLTIFVPLAVATGWNWYVLRSRAYAAVAIGSIGVLLLMLILPLDQLLAGFLAVRGDPSVAVRYGPEISLVGLLLAIVGIPAAVLPFLSRRQPAVRALQAPDPQEQGSGGSGDPERRIDAP
jgi:hypothetical protein